MRTILGILVLSQLMVYQVPVLGVKSEVSIEQQNDVDTISPRSTVNIWYYRTYNGREQKRLWSITEGKWLTDWIDC